LFNTVPPGTFYEYVNYDYAIAATILERLSGERFDLYMGREFKRVGMGRTSYRREEMKEAVNDIAVLYRANEEREWVPQADNWKGVMPERDFSSYVVGSNGAVFSPMGGLYSTTKDLT
jgi:CubicO group peptidase (beta-lactamase class C family)